MLRIAHAYGYRTAEISDERSMADEIRSVVRGEDAVLCLVRIGENEFAPKLSSRLRPDGSIASSSLEDMAPFLPEQMIRENTISE
jgi:acetolactate synthase-1/2/3 large subunit